MIVNRRKYKRRQNRRRKESGMNSGRNAYMKEKCARKEEGRSMRGRRKQDPKHL